MENYFKKLSAINVKGMAEKKGNFKLCCDGTPPYKSGMQNGTDLGGVTADARREHDVQSLEAVIL